MSFEHTMRVLLCLALLSAAGAACAVPPAPTLADLGSAPTIVNPEKAPIVAATTAGKRIVAVGDYGIVILSDDGKRFRQAKSVPTRAVLTGVYFVDEKQGWACGHDGTVIGSTDGGETWRVLREERGKERVLLSVWFENPRHGIAVGQFGLVLETGDGGKTWKERRLAGGETGELHLMHIFAGRDGLAFVAAEAGTLFRSEDAGRSWKTVQTDNKGSFWTGLVSKDGVVVVAGMRGHVYRSADGGKTWREIPSGTQQSLTSVLGWDDGSLLFFGNGGVSLSSRDRGQSLQAGVRADRANITAAVGAPGGDILFSLSGVLPAQ